MLILRRRTNQGTPPLHDSVHELTDNKSQRFKIMPLKRQESINEGIARKMRIRRAKLGMTQQQVACKIGISYQQLQKYEHGRNRISAARLKDLADVLGVPIAYFFDD